MWIVNLNLISFFICTTLAYHGSKQEYIKWKEQFLSKIPTTTPKSAVTSENNIYYENLKLRHHSRHPHLDKVMMKLDSGKKAEHKVRHSFRTTTSTTTTTTDEGLFGDDYGDDNLYDEWVRLSIFIKMSCSFQLLFI